MGKSRRRHKHPNTGYPYTIVRVAQIHVVRPKARHPAENGVYIGARRVWRPYWSSAC